MEIIKEGAYTMDTCSVFNGEPVSLHFDVVNKDGELFVFFGVGITPIKVSEIRQDCEIFLEV